MSTKTHHAEHHGKPADYAEPADEFEPIDESGAVPRDAAPPAVDPRGVTPPQALAIYVQEGNTFDYLVTGTALGAGDVIVSNGLVGIATHPCDVGRWAGMANEGVFDFVKKAGDVAALGLTVYWDPVNKYATITAAGGTCLGKVFKAAAGPDARMRVKLITLVP